jgi:3-hydroxyisobutyrate dehydrogenase-like beta-hydroxyacid dehydrogenase
MLSRLVAHEHSAVAFDLDSDARSHAREAGAEVLGSAAEVAARSEVVLLSLPSPSAVEDALLGEDGILAPADTCATVVDMSTTDPETTRAMAARAAERGVAYADSPVSGSVMRAQDGTLTLMVGADAETLARIEPLLDCIGARTVHCGGVGSGQVAKLCNNMLCAANLAAIAETFLTGVKAGLDARVLLEAIRESSGGSWLLDSWVTPTAFAGDYSPRFRLDLMDKDAGLFARTAAALDVPTPVCAAAREMFRAARVQDLGSEDMTALVRLYEQLAGTTLLAGSIQPAVEMSS